MERAERRANTRKISLKRLRLKKEIWNTTEEQGRLRNHGVKQCHNCGKHKHGNPKVGRGLCCQGCSPHLEERHKDRELNLLLIGGEDPDSDAIAEITP